MKSCKCSTLVVRAAKIALVVFLLLWLLSFVGEPSTVRGGATQLSDFFPEGEPNNIPYPPNTEPSIEPTIFIHATTDEENQYPSPTFLPTTTTSGEASGYQSRIPSESPSALTLSPSKGPFTLPSTEPIDEANSTQSAFPSKVPTLSPTGSPSQIPSQLSIVTPTISSITLPGGPGTPTPTEDNGNNNSPGESMVFRLPYNLLSRERDLLSTSRALEDDCEKLICPFVNSDLVDSSLLDVVGCCTDCVAMEVVLTVNAKLGVDANAVKEAIEVTAEKQRESSTEQQVVEVIAVALPANSPNPTVPYEPVDTEGPKDYTLPYHIPACESSLRGRRLQNCDECPSLCEDFENELIGSHFGSFLGCYMDCAANEVILTAKSKACFDPNFVLAEIETTKAVVEDSKAGEVVFEEIGVVDSPFYMIDLTPAPSPVPGNNLTRTLQSSPYETGNHYELLYYLSQKIQVELSFQKFSGIQNLPDPKSKGIDLNARTGKELVAERRFISTKRTVVVYSSPTSVDPDEGKNWLYLKNFEYFLNNGVDCKRHTTVIVMTENMVPTKYGERIRAMNEQCQNDPYSIEILVRENKCYDMESFAVFNRDFDTSKYDYFVYINCGMAGPKWDREGPYWTEVLTSKLSETVKMVGPSINMSFKPHVQSMTFAVDRRGLEVIVKSGAVFFCGIENGKLDANDRWYIINRYEMGMSQAILEAGYTIGSLAGAMGAFHVSKDDILKIQEASKEEFELPATIPATDRNIWDDHTSTYVLPWGDDFWNPNYLRLFAHGKTPSWSDFLFFKASRGYILEEVYDGVGFENRDSWTFIEDMDETIPALLDPSKDICKEANENFRDASKLFAIVTGIPHSGTSVLSDLIMSAPGVYGGLECGILDQEEPARFVDAQPFYDWMMGDPRMHLWGLNPTTRDMLVSARCDAEMYATLRQYSPLFHHPSNKNSLLLDKTPGYFWRLTEVMDRTPGVPVVVTRKTDEAMVRSMKKRNYTDFFITSNLMSLDDSIKRAKEKYPDRLYVANTTLLYDEPDKVMKDIYDFLGLEWDSDYLTMDAFNSKGIPNSVVAVPFKHSIEYSNHITDLFAVNSDQDENIETCEVAKTNFREASNVFAIVTGIEHSGTTMLSELIMSAPGVFGGFECGILDKEKPADFINAEPFYDWMMGDPKDLLWGLNEETRDLLVNASCDAEMYSRLRQFSPLFLRQPNQHSLLLDKTPGYFWRLTEVMDRTPGVPVVVTRKTDEAMVRALKKRNFTDAWIERSISVLDESIKKAAEKYPDRLHVANTTLWYEEPDKVMKGVYDFLGLEWKSEYLTMEAFNSKTVPGSVQAVPFEKRLQNSTEAHGLFVAGS